MHFTFLREVTLAVNFDYQTQFETNEIERVGPVRYSRLLLLLDFASADHLPNRRRKLVRPLSLLSSEIDLLRLTTTRIVRLGHEYFSLSLLYISTFNLIFKYTPLQFSSGSLLPRYSGGEGLGMRGPEPGKERRILQSSQLMLAPSPPDPLSPSTGRGGARFFGSGFCIR